MRQFISFVKKEFYHIFRDKRMMLILLGIPVVQMLLFGFAITTEVKDVQVAVFDPSKDVATRQIIEKFRASSYFDFVEELTDVDEINDIFKYGKINLVIVFSDNFAENLMRTGDASDYRRNRTQSGFDDYRICFKYIGLLPAIVVGAGKDAVPYRARNKNAVQSSVGECL